MTTKIIDLSQVPILDISDFRNKKNVLFLTDTDHSANCIRDYNAGFSDFSLNDVTIHDPRKKGGRPLPGLWRFDVIIIHYSICVLFKTYLPRRARRSIKNFPGLKVQIIQDEYRWIDSMAECMADLGIDIIVSSLEPSNIEKVYHHKVIENVHKVSAIPGYVPEKLVKTQVPPIGERQYHVVYRGRDSLQYWLGGFTREKLDIAKDFIEVVRRENLKADIEVANSKRLYGDDWNAFLASGRTLIGTEGGASIFDFDGRVEREVLEFMEENPGAEFDLVAEEVLKPYEGNVIHKTITPRCFEAIALRTVLVLYPGKFRGILQPWRHYIPLERDLSNVDDVVNSIKDAAFLQDMADRAFEEIALAPELQISSFVRRVDSFINNALEDIVGTHREHTGVGRIFSSIRRWGRDLRVGRA